MQCLSYALLILLVPKTGFDWALKSMSKSNWHVLLLQALLQNSPNIEVLDVTNTFSLLNPMFF